MAGRPVPEHYRRLPRTIGKLLRGEPIHVLALGSSIDHGDANPRLYAYDEDPGSPTFKQPLWQGGLDIEALGRPDLKGYAIGPAQYFRCTGRLRRELMRKFSLPVSKVLLNGMACGGAAIGESHSGFQQYASLASPPGSPNDHPPGKSWAQLYPELFRDGRKPAPDLVIFGHGANERIDKPDGIAVYEGAVRWFQRRYPEVEIIFCQYMPRVKSRSNIPPIPVRGAMCRHYGIPFIDIAPMVEGLRKSCNYYALAPDGGHPQAGVHDLWFRQLEQAFEVADPLKSFQPQRRLPERFSAYTYGWEGDMVTFGAKHPRLVGNCMIIEDTAFNAWASDGTKENLKIAIDGKTMPPLFSAGRGRQISRRNLRNSSFVHGRLALGDRHVIEVLGGPKLKVAAVDCKVCPSRDFIDSASPRWRRSPGVATAQEFASAWGAPYGGKLTELRQGQGASIDVKATDVSVAYVDAPDGGKLRVTVDGTARLEVATNIPFVGSDRQPRHMENRRGIRGLAWGPHHVEVEAASGTVRLLGLFTYDAR